MWQTEDHWLAGLTLCCLAGGHAARCFSFAARVPRTCLNMPKMHSWPTAERGGGEAGAQEGGSLSVYIATNLSQHSGWVPNINLHFLKLAEPLLPPEFPCLSLRDTECLDWLCMIHPTSPSSLNSKLSCFDLTQGAELNKLLNNFTSAAKENRSLTMIVAETC